MTVDNQQLDKIVKLLWSGNTSEAKRLGVIESDRLEAQAIDLKDALFKVESSLATLRTLMPSTGEQLSPEEAGYGTGQKTDKQKLSQAQKQRRKREILRAASEVAKDGKEFTSDDIKEILLKSDVVIGIPENRINTAIGAVLRRQKEDYERVAPGVYRKRRADLLDQGSHEESTRSESALSH